MTAQLLPTIEKSVEELAIERKIFVVQKKEATDRLKKIDEILRPFLAPRRESDNPGLEFSPTHEWRMKKDTSGKRYYSPLKLLRLLEKFGVPDEDIETLFSKAVCNVNEEVLAVLTRGNPHLRGQITRIRKVKGGRTGSIYEGRRT